LINLPPPGGDAFRDLIRFAEDQSLENRKRHHWGEPISDRKLRRTLRRAAKVAGYKGPITTCWLRHSFAHMLDKGASTRQLQQQLTQSSLELIERYRKVANSKGLRSVTDRIA